MYPKQHPWSYTRAQRIGLLVLCIFLAVGYGLVSWWSGELKQIEYGDDRALFSAAAQLRQSARDTEKGRGREEAEGFPFDPNTVTADALRRLGLSPKQAQAFTRYRAQVAFRRATDIARLRVLQPAQVTHLQRWARFPDVPARSARQENPPDDAPPPARFPFDPNTLSPDSLQLLGLTAQEARALAKYRSYRPRTFRRPDDLQKVRAIDSAKVADLLPWVRIPGDSQSTAPAPRRPDTLDRRAPQAVDINRAQAADWQHLPGIGPTRAERILRYRERLGGFATAAQVGETYGLPDSVYRRIEPLLRISPVLRPLYINRGTAEELGAHPYFPRTQALILVRYRDNHGPFDSVEDLKNIRAISTETLDRLLPYLNFDR